MDEPTTTFEWTSTSEAETDRFGRVIADLLEPGAVVALVGDLGAGKTRLVRAIATGLGIDPEDVQSPTFVLIREYRAAPGRMPRASGEHRAPGRTPGASREHGLPVYHFDTYRLEDVDEFLDLGSDELFGGDGICLVEWADRVRDVLPKDSVWIEIRAVGESEREFSVRGYGTAATTLVSSLSARLDPLPPPDE